ncbi:MAG: iron-containing alcohol dehydrogenase, partial [Planctomycetota bacterium]
MNFEFQLTTQAIFGENSVDQLGSVAKSLRARSVLIVTDPGIVNAGHLERALRSLEKESVRAFVFQEVEENPTTRHVESGVRFAKERPKLDLIIGLGGGSSMDCAKGINFLLTNGGKMEDYWGIGKAKKPMLPSIGIPTTAGTGSEAQSFALISQEDTRIKMACGDKKARFRAVILDPLLAQSVPTQVATATGIDAISHAVESYVTTKRSPFSQMLSRESWRLLEKNFEIVLDDMHNVNAWGNMLLGAHYAGAAIENSMLGAAHACANPLTATYGITHGFAVGLMLPHVVRYNGSVVDRSYAELLIAAKLTNGETSGNAARLAERIAEMKASAKAPESLASVSIDRRVLPRLAKQAAK